MDQALAVRFRFDFDDLRPAVRELHVVDGRRALPGTAVQVAPAAPRPRWLPRLLPVFPAGRPIHIEVLGSGAFAGLLLDSLVAIFATAGAEARVRVVRVDGGFLAGCPVPDGLPPSPHATLVPTELTRPAVAAATALARSHTESLLVLNGCLPRLDRHLGLDPGLGLIRVPLVGRGELEAVRWGIPPGLVRKGFGSGCLAVARRVVAMYSHGPQ